MDWDKNVSAINVVKKFENGTEIRYELFAWPKPLWSRDNVARLRTVKTPTEHGTGDIVVLCESVKDPRIPGSADSVRCWGRTVVTIQSLPGGVTALTLTPSLIRPKL